MNIAQVELILRIVVEAVGLVYLMLLLFGRRSA